MKWKPKYLLFVLWGAGLCTGCDSSLPDVSSTSINPRPSLDALVDNDFDQVALGVYAKKLNAVAPQSATEQETSFELILDSGIDFANQFDRDKPFKYIETGAGVAIADYDNDGNADVYLVATDGPNKLYRGLGGFKFEDVTLAAGVAGEVDGEDVWGAGASFADIDNDGDQDLLVCNMSQRNLLYLNRGDGTFEECAKRCGIERFGANKIGSFCDYDQDGDLDLFLLTNQDQIPSKSPRFIEVGGERRVHPDDRETFGFVGEKVFEAGEKDYLYKNNGDGTFVDVTEAAGVEQYSFGLSVSWLDYDGDGWQDIYIANDFWQPDLLYRNNHDGTFTDVLPETAKHTPWFAMGSDSGDINNDGFLDLMVGDMSATSHFRQKLNMGGMSDASWFLQFGSPRQYMRNALFLNTGMGKFMEAAFMTGMESTDWTWSTRFADLNNDGKLDVYVTNGHARDTMNADLVNELQRLKDAGKLEETLALNQRIPAARKPNKAFLNNGELDFEDVSQQWGLDLEGISHGVAFADFDNDGDLDFIVNNLYEQASIYRNRSSEGNRITVDLRSQTNNVFAIGTKVEIWHDGQYQMRELTPVRGYLSSDNPVLHFGLGNSQAIDRMRITWPDGNVQEVKDQIGNRHYRIVEQRSHETFATAAKVTPMFVDAGEQKGLLFRHRENVFDDFMNEPLLPYKLSQLGPGVAWGDCNGDGFSDLYVCGAKGSPGALFLNDNGERFNAVEGPWAHDMFCEDMAALFFDADGDGDNDLFVTSGGNEIREGRDDLNDRLYLNEGQNFRKAGPEYFPQKGLSSSTVAAADFDRDGDLDLAIGTRSQPGRYPKSSASRILRNDDGKFVDVANEIAGELKDIGMVNSLIWTDYDSDGWVDLMFAVDWGPVVVLRNENGKFINVTKDLGLAGFKGWWHGLAAGDFDSDGDLDYVATNQGLNTKYHANSSHPHRIYYEDFDKNGQCDLVEAEFEGDVEVPMRGLSCSSRTMPFIGKKFGKYEEFALASLSDIYGEANDSRPYVEVNYLSSAILWNDGESGMRVEALPRLAQISPGYGVEACDFNCDGNIDVLIANNFFGSQPETGYMDGGVGLLLLNEGTGKFRSVWPNESGVLLSDDSKGLAIADFDQDGDADVVVGVNQANTKLLINQANPVGSVPIKVKGDDGNLASVGAQITVELKSGLRRTFELRAGGSYLSQSENQIVLHDIEIADVGRVVVRKPTGEEVMWQPSKTTVAQEGDNNEGITIRFDE